MGVGVRRVKPAPRRPPCPLRGASPRKGAAPLGQNERAHDRGASYGGCRITGFGAPESPASSPSSRPETAFSFGSTNPRPRDAVPPAGNDRAGARAGAGAGKPR
jgi:hypothetical protein